MTNRNRVNFLRANESYVSHINCFQVHDVLEL